MLLYRELRACDLPALSIFLQGHQIAPEQFKTSLQQAMVLLIDEQIKGFASATIVTDKTYQLSCLLVDQQLRGKQLGDGLIKAFLNMADLRGITRVEDCQSIVPAGFLKHVRFLDDGDGILYATLPDYFSEPCKH